MSFAAALRRWIGTTSTTTTARPRCRTGSHGMSEDIHVTPESVGLTLNLTLPQITSRMVGAAEAVRLALDEYRHRNSDRVETRRDYLHARAIHRLKLKSKLVADREDELFMLTEDEWTAAEMADALKDSAKEALRASMAILSGLQSVASAHKEEAKMANWGSEVA